MQKATHKFDDFTAHTVAFDGMTAIADFVHENPNRTKAYRPGELGFFGDEMQTACGFCLTGDISRVEQSDALLSKFESLTLDTVKRAWRDDVAGSFPNVQAFIAGHPMAMRRRHNAPSDAAPIAIFVDLFVSASFSKEKIVNRGVAALALVRILSMRRPVELYIGFSSEDRAGNNYYCAVVKMETTPLDLARAAYALTAPSFTRRIMFAATQNIMPENLHSMPAPDKLAGKLALSRTLPPDANTIIIPPMISLGSYYDEVWRDTGAWIEKQIRSVAPEMLSEAET